MSTQHTNPCPDGHAHGHTDKAAAGSFSPCPDAASKICCEELTKFTIDYMDGELDTDVKRIFDSHLAFCPDCKSFFDNYQCAVRMGKDCMCTGEPIHTKAPEQLIRAILQARGKCSGEVSPCSETDSVSDTGPSGPGC